MNKNFIWVLLAGGRYTYLQKTRALCRHLLIRPLIHL